MAGPKNKGLGKGLDALFADNYIEEKAVTELKISQIEPNKSQPRDHFDETALRELADSIRNHGVLQPLVVRPVGGDQYQIVAGERRWRASRMVGLAEVPVVIKELSDMEALEIGIIENLQREDLNPVELALGYKALMEDFSMTQEDVAKKVGKSRPVIANSVRILGLPKGALELVKTGEITTGHAKALLALDDEALIEEIAQKVAKDKLLVRDVERLARERKSLPKPEKKISRRPNLGWGNSYYKEMEIALSTELGRKVNISPGDGKTTLSLDFYTQEELDDFVKRIVGTK